VRRDVFSTSDVGGEEMKRPMVFLAVVLALVLLPFFTPRVARADTSTYDFAVGGGKYFLSGYEFAFSVHCNTSSATDLACATGGSTQTVPSGHIVKKYADAVATNKEDVVKGDPTCLDVQYPDAWIGWTVTSSDDPQYPVGTTLTFGVEDNNSQGHNGLPDLVTQDTATSPVSCLTGALDVFSASAVTSGDVVVHGGALSPSVALIGDWWQVDSSGNLYTLDNTGNWVLVQ
jgi:hypothetical protein